MLKSKSSLEIQSRGGYDGDILRKSYSLGNCTVEKKRGFKPSDRNDPQKREFLLKLSQQIWQKREESSNVTKRIDLQKIFTPATDAEEILPRNRKLYASSAFYTPGLHPTVEDQVELARRISHSLSDISNHQSKGQTMYVNRKKRSVKWVHEGQGDDEQQVEEICEEQFKENSEQQNDTKRSQTLEKLPLRYLMNPRGQVLDYNSLRDSLNIESGLLSPEKCAELVNALQTQKGRGAELFAKRRKKSDKWIVDEQHASTQNPSGLPDFHTYQGQVPPKPPTSPSVLPAYSDVGKHRVQLNLHQEQVLEKYARPGLQVVKSPWEAALETGSASAAFVEGSNVQRSVTPNPSPAPIYECVNHSNAYSAAPAPAIQQNNLQTKYNKSSSFNDHQRDLAYKPNLAQGWKAPSVSLPKAPEDIYQERYYGYGNDNFQTQFGHYEESETSSVSCNEADCNLEVMGFNMPCSRPVQVPDAKISTVSNQNEKYERVDVRKQLQQLERQLQEVTCLRQQQERLKNKRERSQQKWKWQQKQAALQQIHPNENVCARAQTEEEKLVDEQEEYIKVAVRDLIQSFEQQTIEGQQDIRPKDAEETQKHLLEKNFNGPIDGKTDQKELYMPKEIPLESYAPPPVVNLKPTTTYSPLYQSQDQPNAWKRAISPAPAANSPSPYNDYSYSKPMPVDHKPSRFPLANKHVPKPQYGGGGSIFPVNANVPPKQQYLEPTSYQKVHQPHLNQKVAQVSFNPSPLSYDKLAKFENTDNSGEDYPQQRCYLAPRQRHGSKTRNVSPAPFAAKSPVPSPYSPSMQQYSNYGSSSYSPSIPSSTPTYGHHNPDELLHGPTFNNSARGWKSSGGVNSLYAKPRAPLTTGGHMPYTDF